MDPHIPDGILAAGRPEGRVGGRPIQAQKKAGRPTMKQLNQIHSNPLPLSVHPLPVFHPTNPLSLLSLVYVFISQLLTSPSSHPEIFTGYLSSETRSVHVTDPRQVRALWEMGFFGAGLLSRSEPTWLDRKQQSGRTAEEWRAGVREQRRAFKLERARLQQEKIERQKAVEEGRLDSSVLDAASAKIAEANESLSSLDTQAEKDTATSIASLDLNATATQSDASAQTNSPDPTKRTQNIATRSLSNDSRHEGDALLVAAPDDNESPPDIINQEHLQLTFEEAFFLVYGLGTLEVFDGPQSWSATSQSKTCRSQEAVPDLLQCFCNRSFFPPRDSSFTPKPDDQFLLNYVTYHHFRSLGWVPRNGIKFAADYMIYQRGPPFAHAEFAVFIIPSYVDPYWSTESGRQERRVKKQKDWRWLHCMNRVQTAVIKTLLLCYVEIPPPSLIDAGDIGKTLRAYKVREFAVRRWSSNRNRA